MRRIVLLGLICIFSGCVDVSLDDPAEKQNTADTRSDNETDSEIDYDELSKLFEEDIRLQGDQRQAYASYQATRAFTPFAHSTILTLSDNSNNSTGIRKILIIVDSSIYGQVTEEIQRYAYDINFTYGCEIIMESVSGGDHTNIKDLISSNQINLSGVVYIGDIPAAWFEIANDHNKYGYRSWPCDLYYMDMNGTWSDTDGNNIFDAHSGNITPEIFVGRISTKNMGTLLTEAAGLKRYLDKNHEFWNGGISVNKQSGLSYVDKDWASFSYFKTDIQHLYGPSKYEWKAYGNPDFGKVDYLNRLKDTRYEFIQLACHASETYLAMSGGGISSYEIYNNGTEAIGYNLFCCSACNWTGISANSTNGFLAGAHIYNTKNKSLVVVGSTKTGSMLEFADFYVPLGQGKTIGESLKIWWSAIENEETAYKISWYYGMTIIGDPLVNFFYQANNNIESQVTLNGFDSFNLSSHRYIAAKETAIANNYVIPSGKHVVFNAPQVILNSGFECHQNGTLTIN